LGHVLFWLVSHPECIETLREEILEAIIPERELTFESLSRMPKLESFIRETQRLSGIGSGQYSIIYICGGKRLWIRANNDI
jgi:hypothetical protein